RHRRSRYFLQLPLSAGHHHRQRAPYPGLGICNRRPLRPRVHRHPATRLLGHHPLLRPNPRRRPQPPHRHCHQLVRFHRGRVSRRQAQQSSPPDRRRTQGQERRAREPPGPPHQHHSIHQRRPHHHRQ